MTRPRPRWAGSSRPGRRHWRGGILGASVPAAAGSTSRKRPGYLVINPLNVPRRAAVVLPDAALDLRPEGPLRAAQFTDEGVWAVVDLPAFGFAWVPSEADLAPTARGRRCGLVGARPQAPQRVDRDRDRRGHRRHPERGGRGRIDGPAGAAARRHGLADAQGKPLASQMRCERFEVEYGGPALVQATSSGTLVDPREGNRLASFVQRYRLWAGRPILEIEVTLSDLDPRWLERAAQADPWSVYLACRWAWPDPNSMLRRTTFWSPELTEAERPETPDVLDISTRNQRTALLFGGLSLSSQARQPHARHAPGRRLGSSRSFTLGVVLDLEYPFHAAQDVHHAGPGRADRGRPSGDRRHRLAGAGRPQGRCRLARRVRRDHRRRPRLGPGLPSARNRRPGGRDVACGCSATPPGPARLDFLGETIVDLSIDGDAVLIDLTPHELARVEVTMA